MTRHMHDEWTDCPAGEVVRLRQALRARHHRRAFLQVASVASVAALATLTGKRWWSGTCRCGREYGGISCARVEQLADAFHAGSLGAEVRDKIRVHLRACPPCARLYEHRAQGAA